MKVRYYRDAAGVYLGCYIAPDIVVTDADTGEIVSVSPPEAPWPGAVEIAAPPSHGLMRLADGVWADTEASIAARAK